MAKKKQYVVSGVFGSSGVCEWDNGKKTRSLKKKVTENGSELLRIFDTPEEGKAYLLGLEDMDGWMKYCTTSKKDHQKVFGEVKKKDTEFIWITE
jgi:hypothetical protein